MKPFSIWPGPLAAISLLLMVIGSRALEDAAQKGALLLAVAVVVVAAALRGVDGSRATGVGLRAVAALAAMAVGEALITASIFGVGSPSGTGTDDVSNVTLSLGLLLLVGGAAVTLALELLVGQVRATGVVDTPRVQRATSTAVTLVAGLAGLGAVVYGVQKDDVRWELAYAAPTSPSGATLAVVAAAACGEAKTRPEAWLFFERGSTAIGEIRDYFDGLAAAGVSVATQDQALDPALAKDLKVQRNGYVAFRCGVRTESYNIGAERDDAQRKLKKLDTEVRTRLAKVSKDPVTVYFTVGHDERAADSSDKSGRQTAKSLKRLLEGQNAKIKKLGIAEGSTSAVPDDAALVIVLDPQRAFLPEETAALIAYVQRGGSVALFLEPDPVTGVDDVIPSDTVRQSLAPLLDALGLVIDGQPLLNDKEYVKRAGTDADHALLFSTSFGTHKAIKTLNSARGKAALIFFDAEAVRRREQPVEGMKTALIARSRPATFADRNRNRRADDDEARGIVDFAAVSEQSREGLEEAKAGRALVVGDADVISDMLIANEANAVFAYEALLWLLHDDGLPTDGVTTSEDAPIRHTRDEDTVWFYGTTLGAPVLVLGLGLFLTRRRRRKTAPRPNRPNPNAWAEQTHPTTNDDPAKKRPGSSTTSSEGGAE